MPKFFKAINERGSGIDALLNEMEPKARKGVYDGQKTNTDKDRQPELWEMAEDNEAAFSSFSADILKWDDAERNPEGL